MKNVIPNFESAIDLIVKDPFNNGNQAGIFLSVDWENGVVDVETLYQDISTPIDVWHKRRTLIRLPNNVNALYLRKDIDDLMPQLDKIREGYTSSVDIHGNVCGHLSDEALEKLYALEYEIQECSYEIFHILPDGVGQFVALIIYVLEARKCRTE